LSTAAGRNRALPFLVDMSFTADVQARVRATGLLEPGLSVLALLSGGADSVCLVHALQKVLGPAAVTALHVNHGLRAAAPDDERFCAELCDTLGVRLVIERVQLAERGNVEALAREARYKAAEAVRERLGLDRIVTGHTSSDQVETVLYRLATSPGRRALLGMRPGSGRLIRPLLEVSREETRRYCEEAGLAWREDETNLDRALARNLLRLEVLPALRTIHPAVDQNILATLDELRTEGELLETAVDEAIERVGAGGHPPAVEWARLRELPAAVRRLVLRRLAERAAGAPLPLRAERVREIERLGTVGGSASLDLGGGVSVVAEYGVLRFQRPADEREPEPTRLAVPGRCRFGEWEVVCEIERHAGGAPPSPSSPDEAVLDAGKLAGELTVRPWRDGDRMRPLGLDGTKTLQDLFTDRKVPRSLRRRLPVVESEGEIAWVAGVALSGSFKVTGATAEAARLRALHEPGVALDPGA
jgi:tRNA(Ile)-lysidine synthase